MAPGTIKSWRSLPIDQAHAEEDLLNQFKRKVEELRLQAKDLDERELAIYLSQKPCPNCLSGLSSDAPAGVLKQFSSQEPFKGLKLRVRWDPKRVEMPRTTKEIIIKGGKYED